MSRRVFLLCGLGVLLLPSLWAAPLQRWTLTERLGYAWTRELISYPLPAALKLAPGKERAYTVRDETGAALPFQFYADPERPARVSLLLLVDLPPYATRTFALEKGKNPAVAPADLTLKRDGERYLATFGRAAARLAGPVTVKPGTPFARCPAPIRAVKGASGAWLGDGTLAGAMPVTRYACVVEANGPLVAQLRVRYEFGPRKCYQVRLRMIAGEAVVLVEEAYALADDELARATFAAPPDLAPEVGTPSNYSDWLVRKGIGWNSIPTEVAHYPCFRFNFTKGLAHPRVRGYGIGQAKAIYGRADLAAAKDDWRLGLVLTPYQERGRRGGAIGFDTADGEDYLGLFYRFGSRWGHPNESRVLLPWLDEGVVGHFTAGEGRREWGLLVTEAGPQHDEVSQKAGGRRFSSLQHACAKFGETPLDKVKDWTLRWTLPADASFPRVFYTPESLARMRKAFPDLPNTVKTLMQEDREAHAYLTGNAAQLKQAYTQCLATLRASAHDFLDGGHNTMNTYTHRFQEILRGSGRALDIALACPDLTPEERARALAVVAFLAYKQSDPDYWPYRAYGGGPSNPNMMSIAGSALATSAAVLAGHPRQRAWLELCRRLVSADIMNSISADGAWLESPGYQGAGNTPMNETVLILRGAGVVDLTADPVYGKRLQDVSTYFANLLTPPDPRFNGQRKPMALGGNTPFWN
ncbi:MAG TPA: hypothetical protein PLZ36_07785, partial [Armatimonadota bacterium]|nr:hypothetical protein [Armatimonadota bacterium]